jgi:site-specific recombinase XerD
MGQGRVWKRGNAWWIQYNANGRQYRESAKTTRKEQAQALLQKRLQSIWEGRFFPGSRRAQDLTMTQLSEQWLEAAKGKRSLRHDKARLAVAVAHFGDHQLISTLTADGVSGYKTALESTGKAASTVNRHLAVLRSALNLAKRRGHAHQDPMCGVKLDTERNARSRICTAEEYAKLRDAAMGDLRLLVIVGYWTGMRRGEIVGLTWDRFDLKSRSFRLSAADTKEASAKSIPIPAEALDVLRDIPRNISGRVFDGSEDHYSKAFARLCVACGVDGLHFHDLRHTAVTNMRRAGVDLVTIARITGHKTLAMLQRYNTVTADDLSAAMDRVESHAAGLDRSKR